MCIRARGVGDCEWVDLLYGSLAPWGIHFRMLGVGSGRWGEEAADNQRPCCHKRAALCCRIFVPLLRGPVKGHAPWMSFVLLVSHERARRISVDWNPWFGTLSEESASMLMCRASCVDSCLEPQGAEHSRPECSFKARTVVQIINVQPK